MGGWERLVVVKKGWRATGCWTYNIPVLKRPQMASLRRVAIFTLQIIWIGIAASARSRKAM